jgi:hypothetical protein
MTDWADTLPSGGPWFATPGSDRPILNAVPLPLGLRLGQLRRRFAHSPHRPFALSPSLPSPKAGNNQEPQEHGCGEDEQQQSVRERIR